MVNGNEGLSGLRILVVEDEFVIAMDIEAILQKCGCEVVGPVSSVAAALDAVRRDDRLDGVLLDINLQGEPSVAVAEAVKERGVPFVIVTGYEGREIDEKILRESPRLRKPFDSAGLTAAMMETFEQSSHGRAR